MNQIQDAKKAFEKFAKRSKTADKPDVFYVRKSNVKPLKSKQMPKYILNELAAHRGFKLNVEITRSRRFGQVSYRWDYSVGAKKYPNFDSMTLNMSKDSQQTFFHEMAHVYDLANRNHDRQSTRSIKEIIAEFTSYVISESLNPSEDTFKDTYSYLMFHAKGRNWDISNQTILKNIKKHLPRIQRVIDMINKDIEQVYPEVSKQKEVPKCKWTHKVNGQFYIWSMEPIETGKQVIVVSNSGKQETHTIGQRVEFRYGGNAYTAA